MTTTVDGGSRSAACVCVGGEVVFIPLIFLMAGRWDPRQARRDAAANEAKVQQEPASLRTRPHPGAAGCYTGRRPTRRPPSRSGSLRSGR